MNDFFAGIKIFISNARAGYGYIITAVLILAALGFVSIFFIRTALAGKRAVNIRTVAEKTPDPVLTESAAKRLSGILKFPTTAGNEAAFEDQTAYLLEHYGNVLKELGYFDIPGGSILLRWKSREKSDLLPILVCSHLDVVPAVGQWKRDPYGGIREKKKIYGRGALDAKGQLIAIFEAVNRLLEEGFAPKRDVYFAFGHDEESGGWEGANKIAEIMKARNLSFEMIFDEGDMIIEDFMKCKGFTAALIGIGEKTTGEYSITVSSAEKGPPSQSSVLGVLSESMCRIEASSKKLFITSAARNYLKKAAPALSYGKRFAVTNMFFGRPFLSKIFKNDFRTLDMLRDSILPVSVRDDSSPGIPPSECSAMINARILPEHKREKIAGFLKDMLWDLPVEVKEVRRGAPVSLTDTQSEGYRLMCTVLDERIPFVNCIPTILPGDTDSRHYAEMSDCIIRISPFVIDEKNAETLHRKDEYITEKSLGIATEIFYSLFMKL